MARTLTLELVELWRGKSHMLLGDREGNLVHIYLREPVPVPASQNTILVASLDDNRIRYQMDKDPRTMAHEITDFLSDEVILTRYAIENEAIRIGYGYTTKVWVKGA